VKMHLILKIDYEYDTAIYIYINPYKYIRQDSIVGIVTKIRAG
jgi:hypothetical protein